MSVEVADLALLAHLSGHGGRACGSSSSNSDVVCVLEKDRNPSRLGSLAERETKFPTFLIRSRSVLGVYIFQAFHNPSQGRSMHKIMYLSCILSIVSYLKKDVANSMSNL